MPIGYDGGSFSGGFMGEMALKKITELSQQQYFIRFTHISGEFVSAEFGNSFGKKTATVDKFGRVTWSDGK